MISIGEKKQLYRFQMSEGKMLNPSGTFYGGFNTREPETSTELLPSHPVPAVRHGCARRFRPGGEFARAALPPREARAARAPREPCARPSGRHGAPWRAGGRGAGRAAALRPGGAARGGAALPLTAAVAPGAGRGGAGRRRRAPVAPPRYGFHGETAGRQGAAGRHGAADSADRSEPEPALAHGEGGGPGRGAGL